MNDNFSPPFDDAHLKSLAQRVDDNRADLISRCQRILRESLFTNRPELPPSGLTRIAAGEADALVFAIRNSLSAAREHGTALNEMGFGRQSVFGLLQALREFFASHFENDLAALSVFTTYQSILLEGFMESREKRVLSEQGGIHKAVQIALDHSMSRIRESEERYRTLVEISPDMVALVDLNGNVVILNKAGAALFKYETPEEMIGKHMQSFIAPGDHSMMLDYFQKTVETRIGGNVEFTAATKDGATFDASFNVAVIFDSNGKAQAVLILGRDITSRKQAERVLLERVTEATAELRKTSERLKESQVRFETFFRFSPLATAVTNFETGQFVDVNNAFLEQFDYTRDEIIGHTTEELNIWLDLEERSKLMKKLRSQGYVNQLEQKLRTKSGHVKHYLLSLELISINGTQHLMGSAYDITERKWVETKLSESEEHYRTLAEISHDMIFVIDRDDKIIYVNSCAAMQFGAQPDALIGQPRSRWFGQADSEFMKKDLMQVFETGKPNYAETGIVFPRGMIYLSTWLVPLIDHHGAVYNVLGVSRDISGLKELENSLKETNLRLESSVEERTVELRDSRDRLRELTQKIVVAQEEERRRVSRELHDETGQALLGLRFSLDTVYKELPANLRKLRQRMVKALALTDQTIKRIRTLAYDLRPPILDLVGVNLGIKELCREFSDQTGLKVEYSGIDLEGLQDEIGISLYRFVQEALTNVAKHAGASKVQVTLEYQDEIIKASVRDNGRGIPAGKKNAGLGMVGIKERFDTLGGSLEVSPVTPKGTQIQVCLPWKGAIQYPE